MSKGFLLDQLISYEACLSLLWLFLKKGIIGGPLSFRGVCKYWPKSAGDSDGFLSCDKKHTKEESLFLLLCYLGLFSLSNLGLLVQRTGSQCSWHVRLVKETITRDNEVLLTRNFFFSFFLFHPTMSINFLMDFPPSFYTHTLSGGCII